MPEFQGHEPGHQEWKQKVMNREIELEEIDTTAFRERYGAHRIDVPVKVSASG